MKIHMKKHEFKIVSSLYLTFFWKSNSLAQIHIFFSLSISKFIDSFGNLSNHIWIYLSVLQSTVNQNRWLSIFCHVDFKRPEFYVNNTNDTSENHHRSFDIDFWIKFVKLFLEFLVILFEGSCETVVHFDFLSEIVQTSLNKLWNH
jgi:hypothetical protein